MRWLLSPLGWIYGWVVGFRNFAYDRGWFASKPSALPTLVIGNIDVGGTGKTPHTQYVAGLLADMQPAILSRGYGRSTRGYRRVYPHSTAEECGDEPLLYSSMPGDYPVAVCEDRLTGVEHLANDTNAGIVILDDALQHRRLQPDASIALIRHGFWPWNQAYLPAGPLRDHRSRIRQADAIIVSHSPHPHPTEKKEAERRMLREKFSLPPEQPIFFSRMVYAPLRGMSGEPLAYPSKALLVTGIARPESLVGYLRAQGVELIHLAYRDHQAFDASHIDRWRNALARHGCGHLITTAKDSARLKHITGWKELPVCIQDITVELDDSDVLEQHIRALLGAN